MSNLIPFEDITQYNYGPHPLQKYKYKNKNDIEVYLIHREDLPKVALWKTRCSVINEYKISNLQLKKIQTQFDSQSITQYKALSQMNKIYRLYDYLYTEEGSIYNDEINFRYNNYLRILKQMYLSEEIRVENLNPRVFKKFGQNGETVRYKSFNYPEHWSALGYKHPFNHLKKCKSKIINWFLKLKSEIDLVSN